MIISFAKAPSLKHPSKIPTKIDNNKAENSEKIRMAKDTTQKRKTSGRLKYQCNILLEQISDHAKFPIKQIKNRISLEYTLKNIIENLDEEINCYDLLKEIETTVTKYYFFFQVY